MLSFSDLDSVFCDFCISHIKELSADSFYYLTLFLRDLRSSILLDDFKASSSVIKDN